MANTNIEVLGLKETQKKMEQVVRDIRGTPMVNAIKQATMLVQRSAKKRAPVDTGRLRASILPEVRKQVRAVQGVVGTNVSYGPYMETGTGKFGRGGTHWPPTAALAVWAERHGMSAFVAARAIGRRGGLIGRKYLQGAVDENRTKIDLILSRAVGRIVAK